MARQSQMADIDQYISDSQPVPPALPPVDTSAPSESVMAPTIEDNTSTQPMAASAVIADEEEERASIREMRAAQVEADRQRAEESEIQQRGRQVAEGLADSAATVSGTIRATAGRVTTAIGSVPIPGDLLLPLSILLLFFFVLIAVNGHTRLMWLWLTLTGNASLTTGAGASFGTPSPIAPVSGTVQPVTNTVSNSQTPLSVPGLTGLVPLSGTLAPLRSANGLFSGLSQLFTGVEDVL